MACAEVVVSSSQATSDSMKWNRLHQPERLSFLRG